MSTLSDTSPPDPDSPAPLPEQGSLESTPASAQDAPDEDVSGLAPLDTPIAPEPLPPAESFFDTYARRLPPPPRFPNIFDVVLMALLLTAGWLVSAGAAATALHFHLFGVRTEKQAIANIHYTLGTQVIWYLAALGLWTLFFPRVWHTGFFAGIEWRARAALRRRWQLFRAAFVCFVLAIIDGVLLPGPKEAPIDQVFRMPGGAWFLFVFGITLAPLIEEMIYRGFLLPAFCTLWDWAVESIQDRPAPWPDENGKTPWSLGAMVFASIATSVPFALMHGQQTSYSVGTFVLLMFVSLGLCWVRLSTRSLAASTMVHACYNLLLFTLMMWGTGGFKNLDKM